MDNTKKIYVALLVIILIAVLIYAQSIIIPFVLAIIFWFLIRVIKILLLKIKFIRKWPQWIFTVISSFILLGILSAIIQMITSNIQQLSEAMPVYEGNINKITNLINSQFDTDIVSKLSEMAKSYKFGPLLTSIFTALTGIFSGAFTVFLYLVFILLEEPSFPKKMRAMYPNDKQYNQVSRLVKKIDDSIKNYIALKTGVSLLTGVLSYFVLLIIGVDAPGFWAFLIFILNYIPTVGSLVATVFPAIFTLLQFGGLTQGILVMTIVGSIQMIVGNFVEPKVMGNSLNISPLVVFLSLALWGVLWGITGMLLSVPITVILIIIMSEFPSTRRVAILLSQDGKLNTDDDIKL